MPLALLLVIFIVVPIAELYVILEVVGAAIGAPLTIALLAADSLLGSLLLRSQGRTAWRRFNEALQTGRMPHQEVQDGIAIVFGGAFLITPGFLTDIVGLLLLIPPTRAVIRRYVGHLIAKRMTARVEAYEGPTRRGRSYDVEGTASEHPPDERPGSDRPHLER